MLLLYYSSGSRLMTLDSLVVWSERNISIYRQRCSVRSFLIYFKIKFVYINPIDFCHVCNKQNYFFQIIYIYIYIYIYKHFNISWFKFNFYIRCNTKRLIRIMDIVSWKIIMMSHFSHCHCNKNNRMKQKANFIQIFL